MPVIIHDLDNGLGNVIKLTGSVTSEEYDTVLTAHLSQPPEKLKKYYYSIIDGSQTTNVSVELQYIKKIATHSLEVAKINPDVIVVMAIKNELAFNLARLGSLLISESRWNVQLFRTREELDKWLVMKMQDTHNISGLELDHHLKTA